MTPTPYFNQRVYGLALTILTHLFAYKLRKVFFNNGIFLKKCPVL